MYYPVAVASVSTVLIVLILYYFVPAFLAAY
jgi:hypothetical protein